MIMSLVLFENEFLHIVSISFTALILNELIMVALEITTWHLYMVVSEIVTLFFYIISIAFLPEYFGTLIVFVSQELLSIHRSFICRHPRICMEGGCNSSH